MAPNANEGNGWEEGLKREMHSSRRERETETVKQRKGYNEEEKEEKRISFNRSVS